MKEVLKGETKIIINKINQNDKKIAKFKQLITQEIWNVGCKVEDLIEGCEKEGMKQAPSPKVRDEYWDKIKRGIFWTTRIRPRSENIILKDHFIGYSKNPKIMTCSKVYQNLRDLVIIHLDHTKGFGYLSTNSHKKFFYHLHQPSYAIKKCISLRVRICNMICNGQIITC